MQWQSKNLEAIKREQSFVDYKKEVLEGTRRLIKTLGIGEAFSKEGSMRPLRRQPFDSRQNS